MVETPSIPSVPDGTAESKTMTVDPNSLIPQFQYTRLLSSDQAGRRISLLGTISSQPALLIAERAAFSLSPNALSHFSTSLSNIQNLGANDIYFWYLANSAAVPALSSTVSPSVADQFLRKENDEIPPDFKINLIYPCTSKHITKYTTQPLRLVTETPTSYARYIRPYIAAQHARGTLSWIHNILDGITEQEDIVYREHGAEGFVLLPDLNWDRKTVGSLHLLGIVERRDLWSVRDLKKGMGGWLRGVREKLVRATVEVCEGVEADQVKLYVHYQPTYYHFHIHIVHVSLEAGGTQSVGKALSLDHIISQLDTMAGGDDAGIQNVELTYHVGERSDLWEKVWKVLKEGGEPDIASF